VQRARGAARASGAGTVPPLPHSSIAEAMYLAAGMAALSLWSSGVHQSGGLPPKMPFAAFVRTASSLRMGSSSPTRSRMKSGRFLW